MNREFRTGHNLFHFKNIAVKSLCVQASADVEELIFGGVAARHNGGSKQVVAAGIRRIGKPLQSSCCLFRPCQRSRLFA